MNYATQILEEFERTLPATRKHIERLPEDKLDWRPAPKSLTLGQLALHLVSAPPMVSNIVLQETFVMSGPPTFPQPATVAEIVAALDSSLGEVRERLAKLAELSPDASVTFTAGGNPVFAPPRGQFARNIILAHTYHHRGQLGVYLRLLDVPVPSTFGPSADESMGG